ncbi:Rieske 2Fe-2S domain-containing protein [Pigmentiphaga sp.]|uniref:Rieske 2Fe-2S domain-containing protein n=1 Tax=Pigmentiphaga sp. TaxID=1977564 RepID=UPI0025CD3638|nr:Rieske 2Fe-2S domain-containing protein [Pigmentiphaga sp.]
MEDTESIPASRREQQAARFRQLTDMAPDTPMGQLLRQFWHPIAISRNVAPGTARAVTLMGEQYALYRGQSGQAHLVTNRCAHRRTHLHTGWVEGDQLRCMYHGWKFDGSGQCVERPAERPGTHAQIRIAAHPVHEYCGLIFAYVGPGEPPPFDLPRKPRFEQAGVLLFQRQEIWPCHWLQHAENSLDAVHVSFAHQMGKIGAFGHAITSDIPELAYEETSSGIRQTATRQVDGKSQVRVSDWTFPYGNHVVLPGVSANDPWIESANWMVPLDATHTLRVSLRAVPSTTPEADEKLQRYFEDCETYDSSDHHDALFAGRYPDDPLVRLTSAQDYVVLVGQGAVADRAAECLGSSDRGISMLRRILWREMEALRTGAAAKTWARQEQVPTLFQYAESTT